MNISVGMLVFCGVCLFGAGVFVGVSLICMVSIGRIRKIPDQSLQD